MGTTLPFYILPCYLRNLVRPIEKSTICFQKGRSGLSRSQALDSPEVKPWTLQRSPPGLSKGHPLDSREVIPRTLERSYPGLSRGHTPDFLKIDLRLSRGRTSNFLMIDLGLSKVSDHWDAFGERTSSLILPLGSTGI